MGHSAEHALAALRLTLGRWTTHQDVSHAAAQIAATARTVDAPA